ncbi:type II secretion system protein GspG [Acidobacteriota bacterium]
MSDKARTVDKNSPAMQGGELLEIQNQQVGGKFRKVRINPIVTTGRYRGKGSLQLTPGGLQISGRHVFSIGFRWVIGLVIFFGSLILSTAMTGGAGYCAPGFIPIYFLVEYLILKQEEILVPYSDITRLVGDSQNSLIGIDFKGQPQSSPVFMETPAWSPLLIALQQKVPSAKVSKVQGKRKSLLLIVLLIILGCIIIIGIIAAVAIPNLLVAKQKAMQRNAMTDIYNITEAITEYILDNPEPPIQEWTLDVDTELYNVLVPAYSKLLPTKDPWGNDYKIIFGKSLRGKYGIPENSIGGSDILVVSYGRDGLMDSWFFDINNPEAGLYSGLSNEDFDNDIVLWNGSWIRGLQ